MNIEETKERMLEVLQETIDYYDDPEKYGYSDDEENCVYFDENKDVMCAVGRCAADPYEITRVNPCIPELYTCNDLDVFLKSEYKGLPLKFWKYLQIVHDACAEIRRPMVELLDCDINVYGGYKHLLTFIREYP